MGSGLSQYQGRFHRTLGKAFDSTGNLKPKKFLLGTDREKAEWTCQRLVKLWADVQKLHQRAVEDMSTIGKYDGDFNRITGEHLPDAPFDETTPHWDEESLQIAEHIRAEVNIVEVIPGPNPRPGEYAERLRGLKEDYTVIGFNPASKSDWQAEIKHLELNAESAVDDARTRALLASKPIPIIGGKTLYEALDAYAKSLESKYRDSRGNVTGYGKQCIGWARRLKDCHADLSLAELDFDVIQHMANYWCSRPPSKTHASQGEPISVVTVQNALKHLRKFLKWLHQSSKFNWSDTNRIIEDATKGRPIANLKTPEEKKKAGKGPDTYSLEELITLYQHATDRERLFMLMGLNGGFAQSECVHLLKEEVHLDAEPPHVDYVRSKTANRGGFGLWPETAKALRWNLDRMIQYEPTGNSRMFLAESGQVLNGQRIANTWNRLLDRITTLNPNFHRLSFKFLRKTNAQLHQDAADAREETIAIMHGRANRTKADDQADRYYRRQFKDVYEANQKVREHLQAMFATAPDAFEESAKIKRRATTDICSRIKELHDQTGNVTKVATELGVSRQTVYRHLEKK